MRPFGAESVASGARVVPQVGKVDPESPAGRAGFAQGMEIIAVDGEATPSWRDVNMQLFSRIGDTGEIEFTVLSAGSSHAEVTRRVPISQWLGDAEAPYPTAELGLQPNYPPIPAEIGSLVPGEAAEEALDELVVVYEQATDIDVTIAYAGSSTLARQISLNLLSVESLGCQLKNYQDTPAIKKKS